jgi:hypothetical protein
MKVEEGLSGIVLKVFGNNIGNTIEDAHDPFTLSIEIPEADFEKMGLMSAQDKKDISGLMIDVSNMESTISGLAEEISGISGLAGNSWVIISGEIDSNTSSIDWGSETHSLPRIDDILLSDSTKAYAIVTATNNNTVQIAYQGSLIVSNALTVPDYLFFDTEADLETFMENYGNWLKEGDFVVVDGILRRYTKEMS